MTKRWGPNIRSDLTKTKRSAAKKNRAENKTMIDDLRRAIESRPGTKVIGIIDMETGKPFDLDDEP